MASNASVKSESDTNSDMEWTDDGYEYSTGARELQVAEPPIVELDERGDKILTVGAERPDPKKTMRFRVCSRALARVSPVMAAMLFGKFSESTQDAIDLPDDDAETMGILLGIAHSHFAPAQKVAGIYEENCALRNHLLIDDVYKIVLLAEKYLMTAPLRPWAASWIPPLKYFSDNDEDDVDIEEYQRLEKAMFIACYFGHWEYYKDSVEKLVWLQTRNQAQFTGSLEPFFAHAGSVSPGMDIGAADYLRNLRVKSIERILAPFRNIIAALGDDTLEDDAVPAKAWDPHREYRCWQKSPARQKDCNLHTLGVVIRFLVREGLYPLPDAADVEESPQHLHHRLTLQTSWPDKGLWSDCRPIHQKCKIRRVLTLKLESSKDAPCSAFYAPPPTVIAMMDSRAREFGFHEYWDDSWGGTLLNQY